MGQQRHNFTHAARRHHDAQFHAQQSRRVAATFDKLQANAAYGMNVRSKYPRRTVWAARWHRFWLRVTFRV